MFHLSRFKLANTPLKCCSPSQGQMLFMLNIMNGRDRNQAIQLYQNLSHFSDQIPDRNSLQEELFVVLTLSVGLIHSF